MGNRSKSEQKINRWFSCFLFREDSRSQVSPVEQSHRQDNENDQSFELVWFDERSVEILRANGVYSEQISSLEEYHLRFFHHSNECEDYLNRLPMNTKVMFLVNDQHPVKLLSNIHRLSAVIFILIIHPMEMNIDYNPNHFASQYFKVRSSSRMFSIIIVGFCFRLNMFLSIN